MTAPRPGAGPLGDAAGVVFHYDLVCPYSYLLMAEVEEVEAAEDAGVAVTWSPYELRPAPDPLPDPRGRYIRDHWRDRVYPLAVRAGTEIHVPTAQPRSTLALAAAGYAKESGAGREFRLAAHAAFFVEGRDLGDERVLRSVARAAGLDSDATVAAAWDPARLAALRTTRAAARAAGVHGVPSLTVDGRLAFFGAAEPGAVAAALRGAADDPASLARALAAVPLAGEAEAGRD